MIPSLFGIVIFYMLPFLVVVGYSFVKSPMNPVFVGFENYVQLFRNDAFLLATKNTVFFSLAAVVLAVVFSLACAVALYSNLSGNGWFRACLVSPLVVPTASVILVWQVIFADSGTVNQLMEFFHIPALDWISSEFGQVVIVVLFLWRNVGYNMVLYMAGLQQIPKEPMEAAKLDGANRRQIFFKIQFRYLSSTTLFVAILSLVSSFKIFREVYLLTGEHPYDRLYLLQHFMNNTFASLDYPKLSAAALTLAVLVAVVVLALFLLDNWYGRDVEE